MIAFLFAISLYVLFVWSRLVMLIKEVSPLKEDTSTSLTRFSIIIPFRNEEKRLGQLLDSLNKIKYPTNKYEIIFVNDHSSDQGTELISKSLSIPYTIYELPKSKNGKKSAITWGAQQAKLDWLVFTDADCILENAHLNTLHNGIVVYNADYIAGHICFNKPYDFISYFESFENIILQGYTAAGFKLKNPTLANGANWAVKKALFLNHSYNESEGPSGDDVFFLHWVKKNYRVVFLSNLVVTTSFSENIKNFINQKLRWASKSLKYLDKSTIWQGLVIICGQIGFVGLIILLLFTKKISILALSVIILKPVMDGLFYMFSARQFNVSPNVLIIIMGIVLYPFYSVLIALLSPFINFRWKDRTY
jgi:cellulose synthase/poly-beta-1,6-N-acetylglucosamine synthase-like glycosyltransferase